MKIVKILFLIFICCFCSAFCQPNVIKSNLIKSNSKNAKKILNQKNTKKLKNIYIYIETGPAFFINQFSVITPNIDLIGFEFLLQKISFFIEIGTWSSSLVSHIPKISIGAKYYFFQQKILNPFVSGGYTGALNIAVLEKIKYSNDLILSGGNRFNFGFLNLHTGVTIYLISTLQLKPIIDLNLAIGLNF